MRSVLARVCLVGILAFAIAPLFPLNIFTTQAQRADTKRKVGFTAPAGAGSVNLTNLGVAATQDFNTLSNTAGSTTNNLTIIGWYMTETGGGANDNEQYAVGTGSSNMGDTYSYGAAGSTERAFGGLQSGTLVPVIGASFVNNTGFTIQSIDIAYTGEQWRIGNTAAARDDRMDFQYSLDATSLTDGTWTDVNTLDFTNPVKTAGTAGALDGNAAANRVAVSGSIGSLSIPNGETFFIRWNDLNASGADDGLAIDDFSLTPQAPVAAPASISGRVTDPYGRSIRGAIISVSDSFGGSWSAVTNTFGYYRVQGMTAGASYVVTVSSRRYVFANGTQLINLDDNITGLDFTASQ